MAESKITEWTRIAHMTHRLPCPGGWLYKVEHVHGCTLQVVSDCDAPHVRSCDNYDEVTALIAEVARLNSIIDGNTPAP